MQIKTLDDYEVFLYYSSPQYTKTTAFLVLLSRKGGVAEEGERGVRKDPPNLDNGQISVHIQDGLMLLAEILLFLATPLSKILHLCLVLESACRHHGNFPNERVSVAILCCIFVMSHCDQTMAVINMRRVCHSLPS